MSNKENKENKENKINNKDNNNTKKFSSTNSLFNNSILNDNLIRSPIKKNEPAQKNKPDGSKILEGNPEEFTPFRLKPLRTQKLKARGEQREKPRNENLHQKNPKPGSK